MEGWDAQKMLDLYIYDYLRRNNMHTTAEILAKEADIQTKEVVLNDGFLSEWWSVFWDSYCYRAGNNSLENQASTSQPTPTAEPVLQNPVSAVPDVNYMSQRMPPPLPRPGMPNLLQQVAPPGGARPEMGSLLQNAIPPMNFPTRFGPIPVSDGNLSQDQIMANLVAEKVSMEGGSRQPHRNLDANLNASLSIEQFARTLPSGSSSSYRKKKGNNRRQLPATRELNIGGSLRPTPSELALHAPAENADSGMMIPNRLPSEGCSLQQGSEDAGNLPVSNQQRQYSALSAGYQMDSPRDLAAQASDKLIISAPESSTRAATLIVLDDDDDDSSKGKGLQIEPSAEEEKPMDEDVDSFFSNDETQDNSSFMQTLPQSSSGRKQKGQQEFPFRQTRSLHPTNNKLSCCDFSAHGKYLAAAGHEKKVFIWNLKQSNRQTLLGHSQLITDARFKPNSHVLATSSFDKTVRIWDAANPKKPIVNLVGHADQVMSVDFHPRKPNLLCSCDCNDEIKLWNVKESTCIHTFKGANKQVRIQPRHGNFLAAASGNIISLIDVETGVVQHRFEGHEEEVRSLCWDVCGEYLVSASQDSTRIWSLVSGGKSIHELQSCGRDFASCTFHPAYTQVVAVGSYQSICIWNPTMGNKTWNFPAHQGIIPAMANAPETNTMASVGHDQWVKLWK